MCSNNKNIKIVLTNLVKYNKVFIIGDNMKIKYFSFVIICFLFITCNSFKPEKITDSIYIREYQPFREGTKAVNLSETATLRFQNNLPRLDGATALYPLYTAFVQAVYPEDDYDPYGSNCIVDANTTTIAYRNLLEGKTDIIFCAKPSNEQIEMAREKGINFNMVPIGREAFVFFVNIRNPVSNLTTEEVVSIYSGKIRNWSELDGKRNAIRVYQRSKNSGSQTMLESIMGDTGIIKPITENELTFMLDIVNVTSSYRNYRNAIGYSFLFYTTKMIQNNKIKLLSINNIFPSKETIQNNRYPYADEFYAITINNEKENVKLFIEWILSEQGQYLVEKTGYVPIR